MPEDGRTDWMRPRAGSIQQAKEMFMGLATIPARTVMIFARKRVGWDQLPPGSIIGTWWAMLLVAQYGGAILPAPSKVGLDLLPGFSRTETQAEEAPLPLVGWDAPAPANWQQMTWQQQRAWQQQHRVTDPVRVQQQQEAYNNEVARRQQEAQARADRQARWQRLRASLESWPMKLYAYAFLLWGGWQRWRRWQGLLHGERWHTWSRGLSHLKPLLGNYIREPNILRFADPLLCMMIAVTILQFSRPLGWWLVVATFCFYLCEQRDYDRNLRAAIIALNNSIDAGTMSTILQDFKEEEAEGDEAAPPDATPVATPDLEASGGVFPIGSVEPELTAKAAREARRARMKARAEQAETTQAATPAA